MLVAIGQGFSEDEAANDAFSKKHTHFAQSVYTLRINCFARNNDCAPKPAQDSSAGEGANPA